MRAIVALTKTGSLFFVRGVINGSNAVSQDF
jgi:hypothetical protein